MRKNKKRSYKSTLLILLITAILLIVSTYAWFTSNRTVTVETIEVQVGAVNGLQISTNATTWKSLITKDDILNKAYTGAVNAVPTDTLKPVSSSIVSSSSTGRMNMFYGVVEANATTGNYEITSTSLSDDSQKTDGYYVVFDMFLKVDQANTDVFLTSASSVVGKTDADIARGLQNATRIAFVKEGNVASTGDATGLKSAEKVILWEPNNNAHTESSRTHASNTYSKTLGASEVIPTYPGVAKEFSKLALADSYPANPPENSNFKTVTPTISTGTEYTGTTSNFQKFDTLAAGITKYRVYMWIEGQDYDCQNDASGSTMQFNLQFSLDDKAGGGS